MGARRRGRIRAGGWDDSRLAAERPGATPSVGRAGGEKGSPEAPTTINLPAAGGIANAT